MFDCGRSTVFARSPILWFQSVNLVPGGFGDVVPPTAGGQWYSMDGLQFVHLNSAILESRASREIAQMHHFSLLVDFEVQDVRNQRDALTLVACRRASIGRAQRELAVDRQRLELIVPAGVGMRSHRDQAFLVPKRPA